MNNIIRIEDKEINLSNISSIGHLYHNGTQMVYQIKYCDDTTEIIANRSIDRNILVDIKNRYWAHSNEKGVSEVDIRCDINTVSNIIGCSATSVIYHDVVLKNSVYNDLFKISFNCDGSEISIVDGDGKMVYQRKI